MKGFKVVVEGDLSPSSDTAAHAYVYRAMPEVGGVVHTHSSKAGILGRAAAWAERVPAVVHTIHGLPFGPSETPLRNRMYGALERWAARRCHAIVSVCDAMTEQPRPNLWLPPSPDPPAEDAFRALARRPAC